MTNSVPPIDKEKYYQILKTEGLAAALTLLHRDQERLEFDTFEGRDGYQPELYAKLENYREFSRELWRTSLQ